MKNVTLLILLFSSICCFAQKEKKETAYLLFDTTSKEKHLIEDGSGNSNMLNAYRKEKQADLTIMHIYSESFAFGRNKQVDICKVETLNDLKIVDIAYILDSYFTLRTKSLKIMGLPETLEAIKKHFLNHWVVKMRLGGKSTNFKLQKRKSLEDLDIIKKKKLLGLTTLFFKILRKVKQYLITKIKQY